MAYLLRISSCHICFPYKFTSRITDAEPGDTEELLQSKGVKTLALDDGGVSFTFQPLY
jgi:hypothetical protein